MRIKHPYQGLPKQKANTSILEKGGILKFSLLSLLHCEVISSAIILFVSRLIH